MGGAHDSSGRGAHRQDPHPHTSTPSLPHQEPLNPSPPHPPLAEVSRGLSCTRGISWPIMYQMPGRGTPNSTYKHSSAHASPPSYPPPHLAQVSEGLDESSLFFLRKDGW